MADTAEIVSTLRIDAGVSLLREPCEAIQCLCTHVHVVTSP